MLVTDLSSFIKKIRAMGFLVKLDTNGSFPDRLQYLVENNLLDYVAMDIKNSKESYGKTIGIPNYNTKPIEKSVELLMRGSVPYEFRTTLVREYHTIDDVHAMGTWLKGCRAYFLQTFVDSGNLLGKGPMKPFSQGEMELFGNLLKSYIKTISIRG